MKGKFEDLLKLQKKKTSRRVVQIGFRPIPDSHEDWTNEESQIFRRISFWWNTKLVGGSVSKKLNGLYLYSEENSLGKTALLRTIGKLDQCYIHCLSDGG